MAPSRTLTQSKRAPRERRKRNKGFRSDRGEWTLRAGAGAGAGADPVHRAAGWRALARSGFDEWRALDRAGAIVVRGGVIRGTYHAARHFRFLRRQRFLN